MALTPRYFRKMACQVKIDTTYGVDSGIAGENMIMSNVSFKPMNAQRLSRDLILPWLGNQGVILTGYYATIEGDIEIAGAGAAGSPPKWGPIIRMCGFVETITPGQKVEYTRVQDAQDSGAIYFIMDKVKHVLIGARANLAPNIAANGIARQRATITGLLGTITDIGTNPTVSKAGWMKPVAVSKENTELTIHGWEAVAESLAINFGNTVTPSFLIGDELVGITNMSATGTAVVRATPLATVDWFEKAKSREEGEVVLTHGKTPGNIVEYALLAVETGEPDPGETDGYLNYSLALDILNQGAGDLKVTVK